MDKTEAQNTPVYQGITEQHGQNRSTGIQKFTRVQQRSSDKIETRNTLVYQNRSTGHTSLPGYNREVRTKQKHRIHKFTRV
jgi:hypothetical protein